MEDNDEDHADAIEQAFNLGYDVAQAFCSHIVPKAVLLFTGEALGNGIDFEPEDLEGGDNNDDDKGKGNEGGVGMGSPFPASEKMTGE